MSLRKYEGFPSFHMFATNEFREGLRGLFARCPWRTVFAHPDFLEAWYRSRSDLLPILIASFNEGAIDGLVALAAQGDRIMMAGGRDVPVHGWLAEPLRGSFVLERHLEEIGRPDLSLVPPAGAPMDWAKEGRALGRHARIEPLRRRVFRLDRERAKQKLDDKKNTSQLPHVKALGPIALKDGVTEELATYLSWHEHKRHARGLQVSLQNDRLELYRRLDPSILSVTVLVAGDAVLSAMLVYRDGPRAWLELLAENPAYERFSPGLLHLHLLEERWIEEVREIDVTADDDWMHLLAEEVEGERVEILSGRRARIRRMATDAIQRMVAKRR